MRRFSTSTARHKKADVKTVVQVEVVADIESMTTSKTRGNEELDDHVKQHGLGELRTWQENQLTNEK